MTTMDVPDLVREALGDEELRAGVSLGDDDALCLTPTRTLLYRSDGLLSDETVETYGHDVERLDVSDGRRKTKFTLTYVDGTRSFKVPKGRGGAVLEGLVDGVLTVAEVIDAGESVRGVFRFSELTLVVTEARLVKHVGTPVWDEDFEEYPFDRVTGLGFEEGSVATQIVLSVAGRPQRIKAPNDQAPMVRRTLTDALFAYHGVDSLAALNDAVALDEADADGTAGETEAPDSGDLSLSDGIEPLVGGTESPGEDPAPETVSAEAGESAEEAAEAGSAGPGPVGDAPWPSEQETDAGGRPASTDTPPSDAGGETGLDRADADTAEGGAGTGRPDARRRDDVAEVAAQVSELRTVVERQNELLADQQETIEQLIAELRRGR